MAKIISRARQLRLEYAAKIGRPVTMQEVGDGLSISRKRLTSLELGKFDEISNDELISLCTFYTQMLGRPITVGDILEYDPNNKRALELAAA